MSEELGVWVDAVLWHLARCHNGFARVGQVAVRANDVTSVYLSEGHVYITADALHRVSCGELDELVKAHAEECERNAKWAEERERASNEQYMRESRRQRAGWALGLAVKDATTVERALDLLSKLERIAETGE